jgi:hypothetical protein
MNAATSKVPARFASLLSNPPTVSNPVWRLSVGAIIALQMLLIFRHQPWLDEWQAIQIASQSPDWSALLANLRYEGHPPLWYALLRGLNSVLPSPYLVLPVAAAIPALIGQGAILFASPFERLERLLIASSELILFEFFTLSRSLTLGVACLLLAVALWRRGNWSWVFIAVLPLCDFLFGVLSLALIWLLRSERRLWLPGLATWFVAGVFAAWSVRPAPDIITALERHGVIIDIAVWLTNVTTLGFPLQMDGWSLEWNHPAPLLIAPLSGALFILTCREETRDDQKSAFVLGGFALTTMLFCAFVYPLAIRHLMLIAMLLILLVWRRLDDGGRPPSSLFRIWLVLLSACGIFTAGIALARPFDTAQEAAHQIAKMGLIDRNWVAFPDSRGQGVSALTGIRFERTERTCSQDFIRWNFRTEISGAGELYAYLDRKADRDGRFYLLSDLPIVPRGNLLKLLVHVPAGYDGQDFYLFVVRPDLPESKVRFPRCNGPARPFPGLRIS